MRHSKKVRLLSLTFLLNNSQKNKNSIGDATSIITINICINKMAGMPYRKERCSVLCRKRCIPKMEPTLPPIMASTKRVDSGMRHERFLARDLSTPIAVKLIKLITARYTIIKVIAFIKHTIDSRARAIALIRLLRSPLAR